MSWKPSVEKRDDQLCQMLLLKPINEGQELTIGYWQVEAIRDSNKSDRNKSGMRLGGVNLREKGSEKLKRAYTENSFKNFYYKEEKNAKWQLVGKDEIRDFL